METVRRAQGCWTCKRRKIGCDRGYPACNNCLRTGRECHGYGIRLAWPDQPDGRRRSNNLKSETLYHHEIDSEYYGKQFLNVTYSDLAVARKGISPIGLTIIRGQPRPGRTIPLFANLHERESHLISYCKGKKPDLLQIPHVSNKLLTFSASDRSRLSQMISTIDINNGFRDDLLPMALASLGSASDGLRNAMLAVSAFHLWGPEQALSYKADALRSLSSSLSSESIGITETQLATSMMLCVYNVFDETEGNWNLHLQGAQTILRKLANIHGGRLRYGFLYTWFLYHEILGGFSQPLQYGNRGPASLQLLHDSSFDKSLIIGSLGCSVEIMEIISYVNGLRAIELRGESAHFSAEERARRADEWRAIESRITIPSQHLSPTDATRLPAHERTRILTTAELYRIATYLYLQRTGECTQSHELRTMYLEQAFQALGILDVCTSPWPLFVIACETENDQQRILILQALDRMDDERRIGNVYVLRDIIESYWKQQDLQADSGRVSNAKWWNVVDLNITAPWCI
ncbi:fungal-specific transcription factor domain-containing protein [Hypoxylon trugodes]|uniref:fungal-specific transcription factor domain-containing protein n=1 Tax=Hypoxylon trugodes TaxID=326681 RepID=UPI0021964B76|nr:fungal-specific transcription factor domain-containing protein [Hypoxylon trugodes]KAI1389659.1 fungal-specific transcription factor domain-containing protein [Hypoxylon trugodes]